LFGEHEIFDFNNAGHCIFGVAKKLHANRASVIRHAVQDPARAGDQTITSFFLDARQTRQKFVGDVFAQACLAENGAWNVQTFFTNQRGAVGFEVFQFEAGHFHVMDLA